MKLPEKSVNFRIDYFVGVMAIGLITYAATGSKDYLVLAMTVSSLCGLAVGALEKKASVAPPPQERNTLEMNV